MLVSFTYPHVSHCQWIYLAMSIIFCTFRVWCGGLCMPRNGTLKIQSKTQCNPLCQYVMWKTFLKNIVKGLDLSKCQSHFADDTIPLAAINYSRLSLLYRDFIQYLCIGVRQS